ncbi:MAG: hypothetical protein IKL20_03430 [Alistipes sp.]|nr:hypothetical protein [Alistipes sp.]
MKRVYGILVALTLFCAPISLSAQSLDKVNPIPTDFTNFVTNSFINYYTTGGVQEKLYLVTDKPFYSAGDTIYFSAFLVNSIYFNRTTDTKFIYVELIDATGNVTDRLRVMGSEGRFHNAIPLSTKTTPGKYTLRAYSKWQTNSDRALLFSRQLEIGNYIDDAVRTNIKYEFDGTGKVVASVEVTTNNFTPVADNTVEYSLSINGRTTRHMTKTDKDGFFRFSFRPSANMSDCIRMNINANGRKLDRKAQLPSFENDFSAKFLPEGGNLIAGIEQTIAFKAVGIDGKAVDVEGVVQTKSGIEVCTIRSEHCGMGKFSLKAQEGETYIATLSTKDGISRSFTLPEAKPHGCVISMQPEEGNKVLLQIHTTESYPRQNLVAIVQSRGIVNYVVEDLSHAMRISLDKLRSGVAQVSVVDKTTRSVVAQRLFFVRGAVASATITSNVKRFAPRERVQLDFGIKNSAGAAVKGDFVVSVTDAELLKEEPNSDNIFSYMLLNSELKGHIENPKYYFEADDAKHNEHLDLVMLTHGWRRYNISSILAGKKPIIKQPFEKEQSISGGVKSTIGKTRNTSVMIFRNRKEYLGVHDLNSTNRFFITGVDSPDTTVYVLQALNRNGSSDRVRIKVDPQIYPMAPTIARERFRKEVVPSLTEEYMVRSKNTYFEEGGVPVVDIDVVEVIAKRTVTYDYSSSLNDFNTVSGDMSRFVSIFDALQRFRQLEVEGNNVYVRSKKVASPVQDESSNNTDSEENNFAGVDIEMDDKVDLMPAVYVNGTQMDMGIIDAYPMSEVISVSYLDKFESMAAGMGSETGAIILHVKDINAREKLLINSMAEVIVPGYALPMEFYAPDYSVENDRSKRDNRTTIAWVPSLLSNSLGDATMSFWTADRQSDYRVIIEGITSEGELLHSEMILQSK